MNKVENTAINSYNKANSAQVSLQTFVNDPYKQKLQTGLGSPNAPDIFFNWGGGNLEQYVKAGQVFDLTSALNGDSTWKKSFIPSVLNTAKINGKYYGVPVEGVQPAFFFYNKDVFAKAGIKTPPASWNDLLTDVDTLKSKGITPITVAGSQGWTELIYLEYLLDRVGGPTKFQNIVDGKAGAWKDPAVVTSLTMIQQLVDRGAFGTNYASVNWDNHGTQTLLSSAKAGMELMGSWEFSGLLGTFPDVIKQNKIGWFPFPGGIPGGTGNPKDVVGNPDNYLSVTTTSKSRDTAVDFLKKTMADKNYVKDLISIGQVPAIEGIQNQLSTGSYGDYNTFVYSLVKNSPSFTQSWDQALTPAVSQSLLTNLQKVFNKQMTPQQFADAMDQGQ